MGAEFQVNTYTTSYQGVPAVAADNDGDFVVVWNSALQDGSSYGIFARRFSSAGAALASEFQVNTYTSNVQRYPAVATSADGDFVVAWHSYLEDGANGGIFARRFSSAGAALGAQFQVNVHTTGYQSFPAVAADADGNFILAWESHNQDGAGLGVFARRFTRIGDAVATAFQVNTYTADHQGHPSVAADADGDFVIAWNSGLQDGSSSGVFARRFSNSGAALAGEFQVNTYTASGQMLASVAADADGDFVVAWESGQEGGGLGICAQRFSSAGIALGSEFQVNTYTASSQRYPQLAADAGGDFVVTWLSYLQDGSGGGVFARRFSSAGSALASELQVNTYTASYQSFPAVAADAGGDFVVAWHSETQDGAGFGIFAQRFRAPKILDIDADGAVTPLTDGLLVLRYLFGFTGATLTNGAVGGDCARCDSAAIEPYLQTLI